MKPSHHHSFPSVRLFRTSLAYLLSALLCINPVLAQKRADLPELGDNAQDALSARQAKQIGKEVMRQIREREPSYIDDPELEHYLNQLGRKLVAATGDKPEEFTFFALRENTVNAFAMPGGFIGIHAGLITFSQHETELAGVLSHEIGHIQQHHLERGIEKDANSSVLLLATLLAAILVGSKGRSGQLPEALVASGQAAAIQNQLTFSQAFEREADRVGFQIMDAAEMDTNGMVSFFDRMAKLMRGSESPDTAFLRTHPLSDERMSDMQGRARLSPTRQTPDSLDYLLIRAKLFSEQGLANDALTRVKAMKASTPTEQAVVAYSLARVALRQNRLTDASNALQQLRTLKLDAPSIEQLAADIAYAQKQPQEAAQIAGNALQKYPTAQYLRLTQTRALIEAGEARIAAQHLRDALVDDPKNERLRVLEAQAYARLGATAEQQRAQAELYYLRGNLYAAIEQLQLAQRGGQGDYVVQSAIDTRLRQFKDELREAIKEGRIKTRPGS